MLLKMIEWFHSVYTAMVEFTGLANGYSIEHSKKEAKDFGKELAQTPAQMQVPLFRDGEDGNQEKVLVCVF